MDMIVDLETELKTKVIAAIQAGADRGLVEQMLVEMATDVRFNRLNTPVPKV